MTREELIKEVAVEKFGNDACRAAEYFMDGIDITILQFMRLAKGARNVEHQPLTVTIMVVLYNTIILGVKMKGLFLVASLAI